MTVTFPLAEGVKGNAVETDGGGYRYLLTRWWGTTGPDPMVLWVMLNPSVAHAEQDDRTLRRCQEFTRAWGYTSLAVVNLFALRSTDPRSLRTAPDPVGPDNDITIRAMLARSANVDLVVAGWGTHGSLRFRNAWFVEAAREYGRTVHALVVNDDGSPKHPLYVRGDVEPVVYREAS